MIRAAALASGLVATACTAAGAEAVVAPGLYGNVSLSEESGDLGGMELELKGTGSDATVEFVFCEGWCNSLHSASAETTAEGFNFRYVEEYWYSDGSPAHTLMNVQVLAIPDGVRVIVAPAGDPDQSVSSDLPRINERFGLAVAATQD